VTINQPNLSNFFTALGGAAGITGAICTLIGTTPASPVGKIAEAAVSGLLLLISSWHAHSVVATRAKLASAPTVPVQVKL
jgi:hypothetical protein